MVSGTVAMVFHVVWMLLCYDVQSTSLPTEHHQIGWYTGPCGCSRSDTVEYTG